MSYKFQAPDPSDKGEVDFDFFDDPPGRKSPTHLGGSGKFKSGTFDKHTDVPSEQPHDSHNTQSKQSTNTHDTDSEDDSYSSDYTSDSDDDDSPKEKKPVKTIEAKIPYAGRSHQDSADEEEDRNEGTTSKPQKHIRRLSEHDQRNEESRPKTSHQRNRTDKDRRHSLSSASDKSYSSLSDTDSETDSDVTDVSPLTSPHEPERRKHPKSPGHKEVTFRKPPSEVSSHRNSKHSNRHGDDIDLNFLMQVMSFERGSAQASGRPMSGKNSQKPLFLVPPGPAQAPRKNFSFLNENVRDIDKENQRLMREIMRHAKQSKKAKKTVINQAKSRQGSVQTNKMSSASINRNREQRRIEQENYAMLRRLQTTKASKHIARDGLLDEYNHQVLFGCSVAAAHPVEKKRTSPSPYSVAFSPAYETLKANSLSNLQAEQNELSGERKQRPMSATVKGTRPSSAKIRSTRPLSANKAGRPRPQSAKVQASGDAIPSPGYGSKPAWDDRW